MPQVTIMAHDVSGNLEYIGTAQALQSQPSDVIVTTVSTASPAVFTAAGHGLQTGNAVIIEGATEDWAAINGTQIVTVIDNGSFSVAVNSGAFSEDFDGTVKTYAPRTNKAVWRIQKFIYSSGKKVRSVWADGVDAFTKAWDSRATYTY